VKDFLQEGNYIETTVKRSQNPEKPERIQLSRKNPTTGVTTIYNVIDNVDRLRPEDWDNVVAVFASGHAWQFKKWKWEEPVDLFSNVKGFFLRYGDAATDSVANQWNVVPLDIYRHKRHLDAQCIHKFWTLLEEWIQANRPYLLAAQ
jgi:parafibromin